MIVTWLAMTFQAACEDFRRALSQSIWLRPRNGARLVPAVARRGHRVVARLVGAVLALVHDDQVDVLPKRRLR